jgi:hypothetical protein
MVHLAVDLAMVPERGRTEWKILTGTKLGKVQISWVNVCRILE